MGPRQYVSYSPMANSLSFSQDTDFRKYKGKGKYQLTVESVGDLRRKTVHLLSPFRRNYTYLIIEDKMHQKRLHIQIKTSLQADYCHKYQFQPLKKKYEVKYLK